MSVWMEFVLLVAFLLVSGISLWRTVEFDSKLFGAITIVGAIGAMVFAFLLFAEHYEAPIPRMWKFAVGVAGAVVGVSLVASGLCVAFFWCDEDDPDLEESEPESDPALLAFGCTAAYTGLLVLLGFVGCGVAGLFAMFSP